MIITGSLYALIAYGCINAPKWIAEWRRNRNKK